MPGEPGPAAQALEPQAWEVEAGIAEGQAGLPKTLSEILLKKKKKKEK